MSITCPLSSFATPKQQIPKHAYSSDGYKVHNGSYTRYGASWTTGDRITAVVDINAGTIHFKKNGTDQGVAFSDVKGPLVPGVTTNWQLRRSTHEYSLNDACKRDW